MAALSNRKRRHNVRSSSSCSSNWSNENGVETGYLSDNSNSDVERTSTRHGSGGKVGFSGNDGCPSLAQCNVLKKEFVLNIDGGKRLNDLDEANSYNSQRKRSKCVSKNALMARANRIKKKEYVSGLEKQLDELIRENSELKEQVKKNDEFVQKQNEELKYLKSVLANSKEISMLLKSVRQNTGLPVTSSINKFTDTEMYKESPLDSDFSEDPFFSCADVKTGFSETDFLGQQSADKPIESLEGTLPSSVGICLHVAQHRVSLEFCPTCSNNASVSWQESTG